MSSLLKITPGLLLIVGLMLQGIADASSSKTPERDPRRGKLIFEDNFDTLNTSTWLHLITSWRGGENQFQYYTNRTENSYVKDGILHMVPTLTADRFDEAFLYNGTLNLTAEGCNYVGPEGFSSSCVRKGGLNGDIINPIQSVRLHSAPAFSFLYGTVEVRMKLSRGDWLWPSVFLMPTDLEYGNWPRSGEIDLVEIHGNDVYICKDLITDNRRAKSTLHWGNSTSQDKYEKTGWIKELLNGDTFATSFHTYTVIWNTTGIWFQIDGEDIGGVTPPAGGFWQLGGTQGENIWGSGDFMAPFDKQFFIIMKVGAGGNYWPEGCLNAPDGVEIPKPWNKADTVQMKPFWESRNKWLPTWYREPEDTHMLVDYVRVWSMD